MITGTHINPITEAFVKKIHKIMRGKGFKMTSSRQSAMVEWSYKKDGSPTLSMDAWHGNGNYGNLKLILGLLTVPVGEWKPQKVADYDIVHNVNRDESLTEEGFKEYKEMLEKIEKYLREVK